MGVEDRPHRALLQHKLVAALKAGRQKLLHPQAEAKVLAKMVEEGSDGTCQ